jgi:hypothetical protein
MGAKERQQNLATLDPLSAQTMQVGVAVKK